VEVEEREARAALAALLDGRPVRGLVLVQPQLVPEEHFDVETARLGGYYSYPPVGLLCLAAAARQAAPEVAVRVLDLNHETLRNAATPAFRYRDWRARLDAAIAAADATVVGVSYMFGATQPCFTAVCQYLRDAHPSVLVLAGGVQATYDYEELIAADLCDLVFRREAEVPFAALLRGLSAGRLLDDPRGIALRDGDAVVTLGEPEDDAPVDWDLRPAYDLIDVAAYHRFGSLGPLGRYLGEGKPYATVLSNRGCRARCTFCSVRDFNGFGVRQRPVQSVIDEIAHLVRARGVVSFDWLDDDLLWDPERALALFRGLAAQVPGLEWTAQNGLIGVAVTDELMEWMVRSGLRAFKIGVESGNDAWLRRVKKPTTKAKLREKTRLFRRYPAVLSSGNFIIGMPGETIGEMRDTYAFARELGWDWQSFYICQPLRGTEMFSAFNALGDDRCREEGYGKVLNPGRSAERGEFGYRFDAADAVRTGWEVFTLPPDRVPSQTQLREVWFTFNLVTNFLANPNFAPGGNPAKLVRWLEAIQRGYPYDASMAAALVRGYRLLGEEAAADRCRRRFVALVEGSAYWRQRVAEFPELLALAAGEAPAMRPDDAAAPSVSP
jgi:radical SAM superfamily enzyme YgiQ (UPF0313 family)